MPATREIAIGAIVELTERVDIAPAGARGGVTDVLADDRVIVEIMARPLDPIVDRIVVVSVEKLRLL